VAARVQRYLVVFDEIWYRDLQYRLVEFNCCLGGSTLSVLCVLACPISCIKMFFKTNGILNKLWSSLIAVA
jgi:hypothetical protein